MKISILGSGSSGNCTYIATETTSILVDAGFGIRSLRRRLRQAEIEVDRIDAILVTHGHSDHVCGIQSILRHFDSTVYMNEGTQKEVPGSHETSSYRSFSCEKPFVVGDLTIQAFETPHDSAASVGFRVSNGSISGVLATDLGEITDTVAYHAQNCNWLVLEANHDENLLKVGPYPWALKRRVLGNKGHLSNSSLAEFLRKRYDGSADHLFLAHMSEKNNHPQLAYQTVKDALSNGTSLFHHSSLQVHLTHQSKPTIVLDL